MGYTDHKSDSLQPIGRQLVELCSFVQVATACGFVVFGAAPAVAREGVQVVNYALAPSFAGDDLSGLDVTVRFRAPASGRTGFGWESEWAGETRLAQWEHGLAVDGATKVEQDRAGHWLIEAPPKATLTVTYHVVSAYDHVPAAKGINQAWPVILPGWFQVIGHSLFGEPDGAVRARATFDWKASAAMPFDSDLLHLPDRSGQRRGHGVVADVADSVVIGGRDVHLYADAATRMHLAVAGALPANLRNMPTVVSKILKAEYSLWGDAPKPFLATAIILPDAPGSTAYSGTGLGDALALRIGDKTSPVSLALIVSHEFFHHWNPVQLEGITVEDHVTDPERDAWLGEGFTDYYAYQIPLHAGLISTQEWEKLWDTTFRNYARSPLRTTPNVIAAAEYWNSSAGTQIPYLRGKLLAALWNFKIRKQSAGRYDLDDVLRALRRRAAGSTQRIAPLMVATLRAYGLDVSDDVKAYVDQGRPILLPADVFGPCAVVSTTVEPAFDAGFDVPLTVKEKGVVTGVDPTSNAYAAGLRNGMRLALPLDGRVGNPDRAWKVQVLSPAPRTLEYLPQGHASIPVQSVVVDPDTTQTCRSSLSGLGV